MNNGIAASVSRLSVSYIPSPPKTTQSCSMSFVVSRRIASSDLKLKGIGFSRRDKRARRRDWICNCSGDNESKSVLDAFFLGKAIGEALTERIESAVGEVLSTIGRIQSEQQKQVQDFQEEVLERAKQAKEKAAREAMEAQGLIARSITIETTPVNNGTASAASPLTSSDVSPVDQPSAAEDQNPISRVSNED